MCDVSFGVKIPEELKTQINKLMDDIGLSGNEFMQQVINTYTIEKTKENIPQFAEDLKELQILTKRIDNIYLNLGYRIDNFTKSQEEENQELLQAKENLIVDLQTKYKELKQNYNILENDYNESINSNFELTEKVNRLTENNDNIKALNEEYKNKISIIENITQEYNRCKTELEEYKKLLSDSQNKSLELSSNINIKNIEIEKLNELQEELKSKHVHELEAVQEKAEVEKQRAIVELQKEWQKYYQQMQQKYNESIEEYNNKYRDLLQNLKQVRKDYVENNLV